MLFLVSIIIAILFNGCGTSIIKTYARYNGVPNIVLEAHTGNVVGVYDELEQGANINVTNPNGDTALIMAAYKSRFKVVRFLLEKGASVDHKNKAGQTALHLAVIYSDLVTVSLLVEAGADVNTQITHDGNTPLILAIKNQKEDIAKYLIGSGADKKSSNHEGKSYNSLIGNMSFKEYKKKR